MEDLRYPIGRLQLPESVSMQEATQWIADIAACPAQVRAAVAGLSDAQLDTPYREGGWTVRQVVHHIADSKIHGYIRTKLAATEESPRIATFEEEQWVNTADVKLPVAPSLDLLDHLHARWVPFLQSLTEADLAKPYLHPALGPVTLGKAVALYSWHGRHHIAHIARLRERMGW